jgi:hypothetical protein
LHRLVLAVLCLSGLCFAELPAYYRQISGLVWVVKDARKTVSAWRKLGLTDVEDKHVLALQCTYQGSTAPARVLELRGKLGELNVTFLQPVAGKNAFSAFLTKHGDGIFSLVFALQDEQALQAEIARAGLMPVKVLQTSKSKQGESYTFLDTAERGKFVVGLTIGHPPAEPVAKPPVSHFGPVIRDAAPVFDFWQAFGFPAIRLAHATPREDSRYRGAPLLLSFDVAFQKYCQPAIEWIVPPDKPANIYADFLKKHGEGIQHMGMPMPDLAKAIAAYGELGYRAWQEGAWGDLPKKGSGRYAYMDTDAIGGVSVELIQAFQ